MLEDLKVKALFQNTIDVWITLCNERSKEWYDLDGYRSFIRYLKYNNIRMNKFPLCVKESTSIERGRDKVEFLDNLSRLNSEDAMVYTIKLDTNTLKIIREYKS
ncbi:MAG: hypothetical protein QW416_02525 [Candidatus Nitrosocaldaceae archaeon]